MVSGYIIIFQLFMAIHYRIRNILSLSLAFISFVVRGDIMPRLIDLTGRTFDRLTVLKRHPENTKINLFEQYREQVEDRLFDFEDDEMSWRSYAGYAFDFIPEELDKQAMAILNELKEHISSSSTKKE